MNDNYLHQKTNEHKCQNCGALLSEDSVFCINCGTKVELAATQQEAISQETSVVEIQPQNEEVLKASSAWPKKKMITILVGTALIVIGITRVLSAGTTISSTSFGGDFYTYTYRGIVAITEQLASIETSLGWIITAIGAAIDVYAFGK